MKNWILSIIVLCVSNMIVASDTSTLGFWTRYSSKVDTALVNQWQKIDSQKDIKPIQFIYDVDFLSYFDNREYKRPYQIPQTFLNFRLSPEVGVRILDKVGGQHELIAGARYTQPLGGDWKNIQIVPTAYYCFQYKNFEVAMGAIPYEKRLSVLSDWLMYDSLGYMHPNIQGTLMSYHSDHGFVEFMCDWRGSKSTYRQEMFRLIVNGEYRFKCLQLGGLAHLNHKASFAAPNHETVMDDINASVHLGCDLTSYTPLDSLAIRAGYIFGWQRDRRVDESFFAHSALIELYANWWFVGIKNTLYVGKNLQPLRQRSSVLCLGDPFYQSPLYNRTDFFLYLYRSSFMNMYFSWNLHYDLNHLQNQQQLIVRFNLEGLYSNKNYLRGIFDK